jgi:hypothetical protein
MESNALKTSGNRVVPLCNSTGVDMRGGLLQMDAPLFGSPRSPDKTHLIANHRRMILSTLQIHPFTSIALYPALI